MKDLRRMQLSSEIPNNINTQYLDDLSHDFVVHPEMIDPVTNFCVQSITRMKKCAETNEGTSLMSKL